MSLTAIPLAGAGIGLMLGIGLALLAGALPWLRHRDLE